MKRLASALDEVRASRSRLAKEAALARVLASIDEPEALAVAARIASGRALPSGDGRTLGVGWSLVLDVAAAQTGWDERTVLECSRACGDLGEAFALLVARDPAARARPGVPLVEIAHLFDELAASGSRLHKRRLLDAAFARATPLETKYLGKALLGGLRVGAQEGVVEAAIGRAFARDAEAVRRAFALVTDPGELAILARADRLQDARFELGRPIAFMLATPIETIAGAIDPAAHVIEDKIDGVRAQLHKRGDEVAIFARGLERTTTAFPEIVDAFRFVPGGVALDGEIVVVGENGRPRPFQALQTRLRKTAPSAEMISANPVAFVAYDILSEGEGDTLALPWRERRARLEAFARERGPRASFLVNPWRPAAPPAGEDWAARLEAEFESARARGYVGLVLKRVDAAYEAGRRGQAWIKVKKAFATLDVVITAAEEGHGKRAGVLSDYTFGVWKGDLLVNVGKAYSGLTDEEIDAMTRRLERTTIERFGGVRVVRPEIVLEVAFDGVQPSARHKSGFALRFPRIVRIREDKRAEDADRIDAVEALFRAQVETGHREHAPAADAPPPRAAKKKPKKESAQLDLFASAPDKGRPR